MAKPKIPLPKKIDVAAAAAQLELPGIKWKIVGAILGAFVIVWLTALMTVPAIGYWGVATVAVLSLVALGFGLYIFRITRKQREILGIMKSASGEEGRKAAIEKLAEGGGKDALKALAHAQLVSQQDPSKALEVLEAIDISKAPTVVQDEVRSQRAMMYLFMNRPQEARPLVDAMKLERQPEPKARAKYAAVMSECLARTGKPEDAKRLLDTYKADDPAWAAEVGVLLYRAQVYTYTETKNRGMAKRALDALVRIEPNMLAPFVQKGMKPEVQKLAMQALADAGLAPRQQVKMRMKM